ncbi:MAG: hypothetical protein SNJ33_00755 [Rikenellaceae bacterium]
MKKQILKLTSYAAMVAVAALAFTACSEAESTSNDFTFNEVDGEYYMSGYVSGNVTLESDKSYRITGPVVVMDGGVLTVPAGMTITAESEFSAYILVAQGGKMYVNGTSSSPVKFTTADSDVDARWGGIIVNGYAPISGALSSNNIGSTEISNGYKYGGSDVSDNSGSFTYMQLDKTGQRSSSDVEHNGLTLNGVGNGTVIENLYVTSPSDDAVEFFGGSVNVTNLLVVNSDDDMFDFTQGYTGTLKNCYGVWESDFTSAEGDPRGVEADGNLDGLATDTDKNQSDFKIEDMTIVVKSSFQMHDAIKVRRGAKATITNALVMGSGEVKDLIDLVDSKGDAAAGTSVNVTYSSINLSNEKTVTDESIYSLTVGGSNSGATTSVFSWTGYNF